MSRRSRVSAVVLAMLALSPAAAVAQGDDLRAPDSVPQPGPRQDLRAPDSVPQPAPVVDLRTPDAVDGHRMAPPVTPAPVTISAPEGIDWTDATIGAGLGALLVLTLSGGVLTATRQRRRHTTMA